MVKTILKTGCKNSGKPGRPFIVIVHLQGYFAPESAPIKVKKEEGSKHIRRSAAEVKGKGEVFVDHSEQVGPPIRLTLGDDRLPLGLWKSIEHMRKGEKARIMVKPKYGYDSP